MSSGLEKLIELHSILTRMRLLTDGGTPLEAVKLETKLKKDDIFLRSKTFENLCSTDISPVARATRHNYRNTAANGT